MSTAQATALTMLGNSASTPSPVSLTDFRIQQLLAARLQCGQRARLVLSDEAAVADHVGGKDGGKPPFGTLLGHSSCQVPPLGSASSLIGAATASPPRHPHAQPFGRGRCQEFAGPAVGAMP